MSQERPWLLSAFYKVPPTVRFADFSNSVELSAAVLKQTPPAEGFETPLLSKTGEKELGRHKEKGHRTVDLHQNQFTISF